MEEILSNQQVEHGSSGGIFFLVKENTQVMYVLAWASLTAQVKKPLLQGACSGSQQNEGSCCMSGSLESS